MINFTNNLLKKLLISAVFIMFTASLCYAQTSSLIKNFGLIPQKGEFKLSLGSQVLTNNFSKYSSQFDTGSTEIANLNLHIADKFKEENQTVINNNNISEKNQTGKYFPSTLTLTTNYTNNIKSIPPLTISKKTRKWLFKSKSSQETLIITKKNINKIKFSNKLRASANLPKGKISTNITPKPLVNSKYYFEATYNFKPNFEGKFSYNTSLIDNLKTKEKIKIEGTLKTNRNILIKAGYDNENAPEVQNTEKKQDTKIWTEFILKF